MKNKIAILVPALLAILACSKEMPVRPVKAGDVVGNFRCS